MTISHQPEETPQSREGLPPEAGATGEEAPPPETQILDEAHHATGEAAIAVGISPEVETETPNAPPEGAAGGRGLRQRRSKACRS